MAFESSRSPVGWSPWPDVEFDPTVPAEVPFWFELLFGPRVVPASRAARGDWSWAADMVAGEVGGEK